MAIIRFSAFELPALVGELVGGARRVESRSCEAGNLTFGPYVVLSEGRYGFEIEYAAIASGPTDVGGWDIFTLATGGKTLGRGSLAATQGEVARMRGEFEVPPDLSGERFEIRTFFNGSGSLSIHSVQIEYDETARSAPVDFGDLRRLDPISTEFGFDRGKPIDRIYIEDFLTEHKRDIRGRVLEVGGRQYTVQFGGDWVKESDILSPVPGDADATIVADLTDAPEIPDDTFDCAILTQVLVVIYDIAAVVASTHRILKPGGVVLATVPGITKAHQDYDWPFCWGFTGESARRLFEDVFGEGQVEVRLFGNVLSATAFLYGLSSHELTESELHHHDPNFQVTIGIRAVKAR